MAIPSSSFKVHLFAKGTRECRKQVQKCTENEEVLLFAAFPKFTPKKKDQNRRTETKKPRQCLRKCQNVLRWIVATSATEPKARPPNSTFQRSAHSRRDSTAHGNGSHSNGGAGLAKKATHPFSGRLPSKTNDFTTRLATAALVSLCKPLAVIIGTGS